ncbi:hypothetical protein HFN49_04080 [Rhizobium leguminosarum]|uniref:hypothetical protein n=1 Tax=Rhizobium ruizarguesonis TaxID=2081791 RepID=UPI001A99DAA4|nr:hypothetical protein [Rhizobium ruizarguesonis]MBY5885376.1 hypothetical protein [Rhizobium leguminosarum]QSZ00873.1 hypothetical protein J3P73_24180 [Rhizobium ruizarguesonis]
MLVLRILTLPIAMLTFIALYSAAIKVPHTVEFVSVILWLALPVILIAKAARRIWK